MPADLHSISLTTMLVTESLVSGSRRATHHPGPVEGDTKRQQATPAEPGFRERLTRQTRSRARRETARHGECPPMTLVVAVQVGVGNEHGSTFWPGDSPIRAGSTAVPDRVVRADTGSRMPLGRTSPKLWSVGRRAVLAVEPALQSSNLRKRGFRWSHPSTIPARVSYASTTNCSDVNRPSSTHPCLSPHPLIEVRALTSCPSSPLLDYRCCALRALLGGCTRRDPRSLRCPSVR